MDGALGHSQFKHSANYSQALDRLHQAKEVEPGGLDQHDDKDDRSEGNAHAHGLFGGVAAGVLALADKDRQVMER